MFGSVSPKIHHVESGLAHDPSPSSHLQGWLLPIPLSSHLTSPRSRSMSYDHDELVFVYGVGGVGHNRM